MYEPPRDEREERDDLDEREEREEEDLLRLELPLRLASVVVIDKMRNAKIAKKSVFLTRIFFFKF